MSKIIIISGSPNASSRLNGMIQFVQQKLAERNLSPELITVVSLPAEDLVQANFNSPAILAANALVDSADAVVIASPVYKASFTGVLKAYLDLLPQKGLDGKIIAPLFIGGTIAHMLSIDYSLKPVLASMGAKHYVSGVYAVDAQINRTQGADGELHFDLSEDLILRLGDSVGELVRELEIRAK
ncbi:NADPH-dependent FMN reductase [Paenibacillus arenilitoris]|uniref:NADPH-dependent FMN reductase n=1 Tax=Paenibacillus arenilitoris TaxID=2772299 RepID=A0A927H8E0_9BACL|nr:NADPH-dependent FMN reductase [Paenibacillus arenilitoris]MBD2872626.1 NADPH-dependent FMN reductase [Paenibacillus arenilitoris]